mgnify:CR=1 FL=1
MDTLRTYFLGIWKARFFWIHLALSDLRSRWRRSFFGIFWTIIQPLGLTLLISFVFGKIFNTPIKEYAPYILSGIIIWDFVVQSAVNGSLSFVQAEPYIKQCKHPLAIYSLRTVVVNLIILGFSSISLFLWIILVFPENFGVAWFSLLFAPIIFLTIAWPIATILAYYGTIYRDIPHALGLILQALWFISPIYFEEKVFQRGLEFLINYNPIYHLLQIVRAPMLHGNYPTFENYLYCVGTAIFFCMFALLVGSRKEKRIIYYL